MANDRQEEQEPQQTITVNESDLNKTKFLLNPGQEVLMILKHDDYVISDKG
jgi:hypothetical protein